MIRSLQNRLLKSLIKQFTTPEDVVEGTHWQMSDKLLTDINKAILHTEPLAVPLSHWWTGDFASPPRDGFAFFR
jgi:hypothetical protein